MAKQTKKKPVTQLPVKTGVDKGKALTEMFVLVKTLINAGGNRVLNKTICNDDFTGLQTVRGYAEKTMNGIFDVPVKITEG